MSTMSDTRGGGAEQKPTPQGHDNTEYHVGNQLRRVEGEGIQDPGSASRAKDHEPIASKSVKVPPMCTGVTGKLPAGVSLLHQSAGDMFGTWGRPNTREVFVS